MPAQIKGAYHIFFRNLKKPLMVISAQRGAGQTQLKRYPADCDNFSSDDRDPYLALGWYVNSVIAAASKVGQSAVRARQTGVQSHLVNGRSAKTGKKDCRSLSHPCQATAVVTGAPFLRPSQQACTRSEFSLLPAQKHPCGQLCRAERRGASS